MRTKFVAVLSIVCAIVFCGCAKTYYTLNEPVAQGNLEEVKRLIDSGFPPTIPDYSDHPILVPNCMPYKTLGPLSLAVKNKDKAMVDLLIANGALPGPDGICVAVANDDRDMVDLLLARGADILKERVVSVATDFGRLDLLDYFLSKGAQADEDTAHLADTGPQRWYVLRGLDDQTYPLPNLQAGSQAKSLLNSAPFYLASAKPLHIAAIRGDVGAATLLVGHGADVNATSVVCVGHPLVGTHSYYFRGLTPLHWALLCGNFDTAQYLLSEGAEVNFETEPEVGPLGQMSALALAVPEFYFETVVIGGDKYIGRCGFFAEVSGSPADRKETIRLLLSHNATEPCERPVASIQPG